MAGGWRVGRAIVASLCVTYAALAAPAGAAEANPVALENALPGDPGWRLRQRAGPGQLEGYASATSVDHGEAIAVHVRADAVRTLGWRLYRMGWYGGAGGRLVASGGPVAVGPQPTPAPAATGLVECRWPVSFTIQTEPGWTSGVYLVALTREDGPQSYAIFVVRADERKGTAVFQSSVTTYQAYNAWGGKSLYVGGPAREVSFDRPYLEGNGSGQYFRYEHFFVTWAESRGFDLTYVTNVDLDRDPALLEGQRLFLSVGHDEYWSRPARAALEAALGSGLAAAFFSANSVYWQIRLEPARGSGAARRTVVCYKAGSAADPLRGTLLETVRWRDPPVDEPEDGLLGVMYSAWLLVDGALVVRDASHWVYEGSGLRDGDAIDGIVGYETDRTFPNGRTPPGTEVVARSPVVDVGGRPDWHETTVRATPAGAFVFAAGTIEWSWGLSHPEHADARVQRITENVLRRAGLAPETPPPALSLPQPLELRARRAESVSTVAGTAFVEGLRDGPAAQALFRRPTHAAADAAGNVYVADTGNHAVRVLRAGAARTVATVAGDGTAGAAIGAAARLRSPQGVAVAADGTVYVADTGNHRILRLRPSGGAFVAEVLAGLDGWSGHEDGAGAAARFASPAGLALAGGALYVADRGNHAIRRVDLDGAVRTVAGGGYSDHVDGPPGQARFFFPTDLAASDGALHVVDAGNRALRRVPLDGGAVATAAGPTSGGFNAGGFADGPAADARLMSAGGIVEEAGEVLVADAGNARLRRLSAGEVTTLAGAGAFGAADGPAGQARFAMPTGIVRLGPGEWLVVDQGASTLRRVAAAPPAPGDGPAPVAEPGAGAQPQGGSGAGGGCVSAGGAGALGLLAAMAVASRMAWRRGSRRAPVAGE